MPDLNKLTGDLDSYIRLHSAALASGPFEQRALACWGLVACGADALGWVADALATGDDQLMSDAAGVLKWVGVPVDWSGWLRALVESMPDGEAADSLQAALEHAGLSVP